MLRLMGVFFRISVLNELAYRSNFWIQAIQSVVGLGTALLGLAVVFHHTDDLAGWRSNELLALVGIYTLMSGVIGMGIQPSLERFVSEVQAGTLDFTLTKPADAQLLVSIQELQIWKLIDLALGVGLIWVALARQGLELSFPQACEFGVALLAGGAIVYSFWLLLATTVFWFVRVDNILAIFQGMYMAGRWPVTIYPPWLRWMLTFLVPVAFAVTVPAEALVGRLERGTLWGAVGLALALLIVSRLFWKLGVRRYAGASA